MKVVQINSCNYGGTGAVVLGIMEKSDKMDLKNEFTFFVPQSRENRKYSTKNTYYFSNRIERNLHQKLFYFTGKNGCFSRASTRKLISRLKKMKPDIIHLHNLHGSYINLPLLFSYLKSSGVRIIWTLHDCWSFTGQCSHFALIGCEKWKNGCYSCERYNSYYPKSRVDNTKKMYTLKKNWFTGVDNMTLVTPSEWLGNLVKQSYLKDYPVYVINNGIDLNTFKPTESDFRKKHGLDDKFIVLGVALGWGFGKGIDVFEQLSRRLPENYKIVLVGTSERDRANLPEEILALPIIRSQTELAEIYTAADLFVNPTREEVFGFVNAESLACGTPVLMFETGGCPEIIDETCGKTVEQNDVDSLVEEIYRIEKNRPYSCVSCIDRAKKYDINKVYDKYIELYQK